MHYVIALLVLLFSAPAFAEDAGIGLWYQDIAGNFECAGSPGGTAVVVSDGTPSQCYHTFAADVNTMRVRVGQSIGRICVVQVSGSNEVTVYMMDHADAITDAEAQPIPGMTGWTGASGCKDLPGNGYYYVAVDWSSGETRVSITGVK